MPELPEVETIRRFIRRIAVGKRIVSVAFGDKHYTTHPAPAQLRRTLIGRTIQSAGRRGKYIILGLSADSELVIHLGMSGRILRLGAATPIQKHEHMRLILSDGFTLSLIDPRRFGRLCVKSGDELPDLAKGLGRMGPEPIDDGFTAEFLQDRLKGRKAPVKSLLLDQRVACGVGNIYSDEALFHAGIRPSRPAGQLTTAEVRRLAEALRSALTEGIRCCGTTMRDGGYVRPDGRAGSFQNHLCAYGLSGEPCRKCGTRIRRTRIGSRSTHYCPRCQR